MPDTTQPILQAFDVDLTQGLMLLSFSEVVDSTTFQEFSLALSNGSSTLVLDGVSFNATATTVVRLAFLDSMLDDIKTHLTLFVSNRTSQLVSFTSQNAIQDGSFEHPGADYVSNANFREPYDHRLGANRCQMAFHRFRRRPFHHLH